MRAQVFEQVLQPVDTNTVGSVDHLRVAWGARVGRPNGNVVGFDAKMLEALLHRNADGAAAAPQADQEVRPESGFDDIGGELKRICEQVVGGDDTVFHLSILPAVEFG